MIPKECKRLAEVDFPIALVSKHSAREKSIRHGHPSTLHLWWARRPLAACRAMLLALLLPDPCDEYCPSEFKESARRLLSQVQGRPPATDEDLQKGLLKFIADFANWDLSANSTYLEVSRGMVKAAYPRETPLVVDPFAGGGSIPFEALRLGCDTFASDLNPVACLIEKVMLEDVPRHGPELATEVRRLGAEIQAKAAKLLAEFYPTDADGARPIAYLWARTVTCEAPNCGAEIPLVRSFWFSKKATRKQALSHRVMRDRNGPPYVEFRIFEPTKDSDVPPGTVSRAKAKCICCGTVLAPDRVRAQLSVQRGGADVVFDEHGKRSGGAKLLAVVVLRQGDPGRSYRLPTARDYESVWNASKSVAKLADERIVDDLKVLPTEPLPERNTNCFRIPNYGMKTWADISTNRQKLSLSTLAHLVRSTDESSQKTKGIRECLALVVSRCADYNSSLNSWSTSGEFVRGTFARQALSMVWDFCETMPYTSESGGFVGALDWVGRVIESAAMARLQSGQVEQADACKSPVPDESVSVWFTDPPYYDAVGYAELSDFFFVWLKRLLPGHKLIGDPFDPQNPLVPKKQECVQDESYESVNGDPKGREFFEQTIALAFKEGRRVIKTDGIGSVVFAHKTTEGWEALLSGMIRGGWTITGSWPIATERPGRLRSQESAALATSVHLICRPRTTEQVGDWATVLRELPKRVGYWMERLQAEHIRGADLVFACIGPALEIFSRYSRVETADGHEVQLAQYLEKVWEVVGRTALEHVLGTAEAKARNGAAGALEEDARLTALFLWTLQSTDSSGAYANDDRTDVIDVDDEEEEPESNSKKGGYSLIYDVARRFAQPLGIHLEQWEGRIIDIEKGVVRLLAVHERAKQLFGEGGAQSVAEQIERSPTGSQQLGLFPDEGAPQMKVKRARKRPTSVDLSDEAVETHRREATTLDRVHASMLLQAGGRTNALRALLKAEQDRGSDFMRLANSLTALYPRDSEEKRLLDAMLLAAPK